MPEYTFTLSWTMTKTVIITAETPGEAYRQAYVMSAKNGEYLDESFDVTWDGDVPTAEEE